MEREHDEETRRVARPPEAEPPLSERDLPLAERHGAGAVLALQRSAGNQAVQRFLARAVFKDGGKGVAVPAEAKSVARWVMAKPSVGPGGKLHLANVQNRGFPGFKMYKDEYAGGRVFNNGAQPDHNKLPYLGGQTYQEWDVHPCVLGQNRGGDRIVTSSDGKAYFSSDHYNNFTEFTP
jgi:hypothetical protein